MMIQIDVSTLLANFVILISFKIIFTK